MNFIWHRLWTQGDTRNVEPFALCVTVSLYRTNTVVLRDECRAQHNAIMPGMRGTMYKRGGQNVETKQSLNIT